jgi:hypothetical protein
VRFTTTIFADDSWSSAGGPIVARYAVLYVSSVTNNRRTKRRARYNRGKLGVRPRKRCGR